MPGGYCSDHKDFQYFTQLAVGFQNVSYQWILRSFNTDIFTET